MKAHIRGYRSYSRNKLSSENLYKTLVGADCEGPFQLGEIQRGNVGTQHGLSILCQLTNSFAKFSSARRWHHASTRAHEQRISCGGP
jgi:hypothetical protein